MTPIRTGHLACAHRLIAEFFSQRKNDPGWKWAMAADASHSLQAVQRSHRSTPGALSEYKPERVHHPRTVKMIPPRDCMAGLTKGLIRHGTLDFGQSGTPIRQWVLPCGANGIYHTGPQAS